jgi:hypothetical protein
MPQGVDMFGSLVVIYPTPHEGGELILCHKDCEWNFDVNSLTSSQPSPSLAYVTFYSDTKHKVMKVTSGHRVTVIYNLYLVDLAPRPGVPTITPNFKPVSNLQTMFKVLFKGPELLPNGGALGFASNMTG